MFNLNPLLNDLKTGISNRQLYEKYGHSSYYGFSTVSEYIANKNISKLIAAIENEDHVGIKSLFAPNIIAEIDDFDQNINDLLSYYIGKNGSYGSHGLGTEYDRDSGIEKRWHNMSYDITTTEDVFRIAIIWYIQDTEDVGNVGIWSLYIIRFEDDPYPNYDYGGDGLWSPGLHIGKTYIGELD